MSRVSYQPTNKWKHSAAVWATVQQARQTVEDYISKVQEKALKANMSDDQTRFSIINGLRKGIRQVVVQHEPQTIADIRK